MFPKGAIPVDLQWFTQDNVAPDGMFKAKVLYHGN